jgi:AraC family transcriptional regulator of adaptative response / DNA-3-methyladenine glycosylase II
MFDHDQCYAIICARDARHDGRFFIGVKTTGVYCRPVCPARTPKRSNVTFYPSAAAAELAGYRPCLRCRPEASPGTPAWNRTGATVGRALKLIEEGAMDEGGVDELAARVGVGARHLLRLFVEHVGAGPVAVAQSRRVHLAKMLLDQTTLPITDIAFAAGFSSLRRFNAAFSKTYARSPRDIRRSSASTNNGDGLVIRLSYRPPFDWDQVSGFLAGRAIAGVERVSPEEYVRTVRLEDVTGTIRVRPAKNGPQLNVVIPVTLAKHTHEIVRRVRRVFDLRADSPAIGAHLGCDSLLNPLVAARPGLRVAGAWDGFELAVRALLGQQVTVKAATTLSGRLARRYGERIEGAEGEELAYVSPTAERLARAQLNNLGAPESRANAIRTLARAVCDGRIRFETPADPEQWIASLMELPGFGAWTAQYIAMRALNEPDAFPAGDLALQKMVSPGTRATEKQLLQRAEAWRPWRAYAAMHLWTSFSSGG